MKRIFIATMIFSGFATQAQDLANYIPKNATAVATLRGDKLLELMSVQEFNNSLLGKKLVKKVGKKAGATGFKSVEDSGIRLNGTIYYYNQQTDSISYNCLLLPIADAAKFARLFEGQEKPVSNNNGFSSIVDEKDGSILTWNNEKALFISGSLKENYIEDDSLRSERYGIKRVNYGDYYYDSPVATEPVYADTTVVATDEPEPVKWDAPRPPVADVAADAADAAAVTEDDYRVDTAVATPADTDDPQMVVAEVVSISDYNNEGYAAAYEANRLARKKLAATWISGYAATVSRKSNTGVSILDNPAYLRSLDKEAAATFYLADVPSLYRSFVPFYSYRYLGMADAMKGYGSINAKLYLGKEDARIVSEMEVDDQKAASYKKMYAHKPNKKFAQYINSDKMVGFMSYSFDTEAYLKELPELLNQSMGRYLGLYHDEIGIGADLFSLLLDEKAVAKVIKGDALLLFSDIGPKEHTYTTYEYNDNYERSEITKTKTETLPDFLLMVSSDDTRIFERILNYGVKKEAVTLKNGIYTLDSKRTSTSPFTIHVLFKDGIIFCGTAYRDIQQISTGNYQGNISKEQKNLLLKNNVSVFFNPKNIIGKISETEFGNARKLQDLNTLLGNTGSLYARTTGIKGNRISGEMVAEIPEGKGNALQYFFSLVEYAAKLD